MKKSHFENHCDKLKNNQSSMFSVKLYASNLLRRDLPEIFCRDYKIFESKFSFPNFDFHWILWLAPRQKCQYSELFWSVFAFTRTEYGEILRISPYSVRMRKNADQNNSEYGHFSLNVGRHKIMHLWMLMKVIRKM